MKNPKRFALARIAAAAAAGLSLLALSACGGSGDASTGAAGANGGKTPLKVAVAPIHFETAYIAQKQGYFDEAGLDVEITRGQDPASLLSMAVSGQVDVTIGSWINIATSATEGVPIQVIGGNGVVDPKANNSGLMVAKDSGIKSLADLKGKTIGVQGVKSGGDIPVLQALEDAGVDPKQVTEVAIPYSGMQAALEQKTVDAVVPADTFYHQMADAGYVTLSNPVLEYQANMPVTVWAATKDWLAGHGDTAEKFLGAMEKAVDFYSDKANLDAVKAIHAEVNQVDVKDVKANFVPMSVKINVKEGAEGIAAMEHFGLIKDAITVDQLLWEDAPRRESAASAE